MTSKTIKRIACQVNKIPVGCIYHPNLVQALYARLLTCHRLHEIGLEAYDIGKLLGIESHVVKKLLDAYSTRIEQDEFFKAINENFYERIEKYGKECE